MGEAALALPTPPVPEGFTFAGWQRYDANELHGQPYYVATVTKDGARARVTLDERQALEMSEAELRAFIGVATLQMVTYLQEFFAKAAAQMAAETAHG